MRRLYVALAAAILLSLSGTSFASQELGEQWKILQHVDEMDDSVIHVVMNFSKKKIQVNGTDFFPRMAFVGKKGGTFSCSISTGYWLGNNDKKEITYRIDNAKAQKSFAWFSLKKSIILNDPKNFAKKLYGHKRLRVRFTDAVGSSHTLEFDISNIQSALQVIAEEAEWK